MIDRLSLLGFNKTWDIAFSFGVLVADLTACSYTFLTSLVLRPVIFVKGDRFLFFHFVLGVVSIYWQDQPSFALFYLEIIKTSPRFRRRKVILQCEIIAY